MKPSPQSREVRRIEDPHEPQAPAHEDDPDAIDWRESLRGNCLAYGLWRSFCHNCKTPLVLRNQDDCFRAVLCEECAAGVVTPSRTKRPKTIEDVSNADQD